MRSGTVEDETSNKLFKEVLRVFREKMYPCLQQRRTKKSEKVLNGEWGLAPRLWQINRSVWQVYTLGSDCEWISSQEAEGDNLASY